MSEGVVVAIPQLGELPHRYAPIRMKGVQELDLTSDGIV